MLKYLRTPSVHHHRLFFSIAHANFIKQNPSIIWSILSSLWAILGSIWAIFWFHVGNSRLLFAVLGAAFGPF
jgi:hypothetical protein